jgi:hypothetical protein
MYGSWIRLADEFLETKCLGSGNDCGAYW